KEGQGAPAGAAAGKLSEGTGANEQSASKTQAIDEPPSFAPGAGAPGASEGKPGAPAPGLKEGQWFIQAAALSSESAARQLSERLSKAGMVAFVERTVTAGTVLYRVRLGPFASRDAAVKARRHLHALGLGSSVVRVEQAER